MHSALQWLVNDACRIAGKPIYNLRDQPGYEMVYKVYCSRKLGDVKGSAAEAAIVHCSFGKDDYFRGCDILMASPNRLDARTLSMTTYQAATVG